MIPARRRSRIAIATPVLLTVLALTPLSAALLPTATARAETPTSPIDVTLATLRPLAPQPGDTLVLTGTFRNVSDSDLTDVASELKLGISPIGTRGAFQQYGDDPDGGLTAFPELVAATGVTLGVPSTLAPGQAEPFRLDLPLTAETLSRFALPTGTTPTLAGQPWQVRQLGVSVSANSATGQVTGALRTFLPWAPRDATGVGFPTGVAWVWPLIDRPNRSASSIWFDDALAPEISGEGPRAGRLTGLLNAGIAAQTQQSLGRHPRIRNVPVTWAIDPMLVSDVQAMTGGYRVATTSGTTAGAGTAPAKVWLAGLRGAVADSDAAVMPVPYADPDVVAAARARFSPVLGLATASGLAIISSGLGTTDPLRYGWPPGGFADERAINELAATGDSTIVLSDAAVPPIGGTPPVTPSARTDIATSDGPLAALLTDSGLDADVNNGVDAPDGSRVSLQRFLAETLMIHAESPGRQRDVVVAPDRRWDPTPDYATQILTDTGKVPWITPISLRQARNSPPSTDVQRQLLTYPFSARRDELPPAYLNSVGRVRRDISAFGAILPPGSAEIRNYTRAEEQTLSSAWRQEPGLAHVQLATLASSVAAEMHQVRITSHRNSFVTLTSHGGKVPVTISNNLGTTVQVKVRVLVNQRLSLSNNGEVPVTTIPAHQQTQVDVHATAKTSGVFPISVQLLTPKGQAYGRPVPLFVRSTVYGTITLLITGAATAALMVAVAIRLTRRAIAARRSSAAADA